MERPWGGRVVAGGETQLGPSKNAILINANKRYSYGISLETAPKDLEKFWVGKKCQMGFLNVPKTIEMG